MVLSDFLCEKNTQEVITYFTMIERPNSMANFACIIISWWIFCALYESGKSQMSCDTMTVEQQKQNTRVF